MEDILQQTGLSEIQAKTYLHLLQNGEMAPPAIAEALRLTRSNAYKVLDSLQELGLIARSEVNKKFVYRAEDPIALSSMVASERNRVIALEQSVREAMSGWRAAYEKTTAEKEVRTYRGNPAVAGLYEHQAKLEQPIYFIKTRSDIPVMGYETMDRLRKLPATLGTERHGITPDVPEASYNPAIDRSTNLNRTWIHADDYTAPVEWTASGDELMIITFEDEASAIRIKNRAVVRAFKELWHLLDRTTKQLPEYKKLPNKAARKV